jgi:hypothetical protein
MQARTAAGFGSGLLALAMVTAVTVDISISSWRKSHPLSEEHVAHTDEAEVSNKERTIQRLVDDRDMWRALGKTVLGRACGGGDREASRCETCLQQQGPGEGSLRGRDFAGGEGAEAG